MTDHMPPEALSSMPVPDRIVPKPDVEFTYTPPAKSQVNPANGQQRRGRGRPPGAKNKIKEPSGGVNTPMRLNNENRNPPRQPRPTDPVDEREATKEEKKARAAQYSSFIVDELNDKLFMLIIGATAIPAEAIYKEGRVPPKAQTNPNLTEFGNSIAIPADLADSWGKLIAELTYTNVGKGLVKAGTNPNTGIVVAGLAAVFSTYRYFQQLKPALDLLKQAAQQSQESNEGS